MIQRVNVVIAILLVFSFVSDPIDRESVNLLKDYLKIDTTNPPGGEIAAARFFAAICAREGIEHRVFEPFPGRGTFWARIKGDGSKRPLILLNHTDVVPHSREFWTVDPFAAVEKDGFIFGRGAMDMKALGIAQFVSLLSIHREMKSRGVVPRRDLIFLATADEESGGIHGAGWFARQQRALLANAEFLLNEGGQNVVDMSGEVRAIGVGPSEKTPVWLRLTATGPAGHASIPNPNSAADRLIRALAKLQGYKPAFNVTPVVEQSFRAMAPLSPPQMREKFERIKDALNDAAFARDIEKDPGLSALLRNTISITVFSASNKTNVISPSATAEVDTRIVPGDTVDRWIGELKGVIADDLIKIDRILAFEANASPTDSELVRNVDALIKDKFPGARMIFPVLAGFTDCHFFRDLGIASYGFSPFVAKPQLAGRGYHGNNERIGSVEFVDGVRLYGDLVSRIVK